MKQITLKQFESASGLLVDYKELILMVCKHHPKGITVDEMEKAVRVITRARVANGMLRLEDSDHSTLVAYLSVYPFSQADEALIQFSNDVKNAETVEV